MAKRKLEAHFLLLVQKRLLLLTRQRHLFGRQKVPLHGMPNYDNILNGKKDGEIESVGLKLK